MVGWKLYLIITLLPAFHNESLRYFLFPFSGVPRFSERAHFKTTFKEILFILINIWNRRVRKGALVLRVRFEDLLNVPESFIRDAIRKYKGGSVFEWTYWESQMVRIVDTQDLRGFHNPKWLLNIHCNDAYMLRYPFMEAKACNIDSSVRNLSKHTSSYQPLRRSFSTLSAPIQFYICLINKLRSFIRPSRIRRKASYR